MVETAEEFRKQAETQTVAGPLCERGPVVGCKLELKFGSGNYLVVWFTAIHTIFASPYTSKAVVTLPSHLCNMFAKGNDS